MSQVPQTQDMLLSQDSGLAEKNNIHLVVLLCHRKKNQIIANIFVMFNNIKQVNKQILRML